MALGGGTGAAIGIGFFFRKDHEVRSAVGFLEDALNHELFQDITEYRRSLGYTSDLILFDRAALLSAPTKEPFRNYMPDRLFEHGEVVGQVLNITLGSNATKLVKSVQIGDITSSGIYFNPGTSRSCNISVYYDTPAYSQDFLNVTLHEAIGHGTDPDLTHRIFSLDDLIKAEHGRWKMVAQSFSVPDQFFHHEHDLMRPYLEKELGASIAWTFRTDALPDNISTGKERILSTLHRVANEEGKKLKEMKFNKRISKRIGSELFPLIRKGDIRLKAGLQQTYEKNMDTALTEMYAEMMKISLAAPEQLQGNEEILAGCEEVLSAVQQKPIDLVDLRKQLQSLITGYNSLLNETDHHDTITIDTSYRQHEETILAEERAFRQLVSQISSELNAAQKGNYEIPTLSDFTECYTRVLQEYPELYDTFAIHLNDTFDPEMDIWEIQKIEWAMDSTFAKETLLHNKSDDVTLAEKTAVLASFISSPSFKKRNNFQDDL